MPSSTQPEIPLEVRQEWTRIRQIMYEPSNVWLATENSGDRWLTDQFVLLDVTGSPALGQVDDSTPPGLETIHNWIPDGPYKLTASNGFVLRESVPQPDLEVYFAAVASEAQWRNAVPTEWSVAEHPGKAMLWTCRDFPCLLGESTWSQIKRHYPDVTVDYTFTHNLFRFSDTDRIPFAFAAGIRVPDGQQEIAKAVAEKAAA